MGEWLVNALIIGFIAWLFWIFLRPRYLFVIRINGGQPFIRKGRVTQAFLEQVATVCQQGRVARGWIGGVRHGRRIRLRFSPQFPAGPQQQLRNEWVLTSPVQLFL